MKENKPDPVSKSLIEKARNNPTIMEICHHEYLGDYGKSPHEDWEPSDKEVLAVIERIDFKWSSINTNIKTFMAYGKMAHNTRYTLHRFAPRVLIIV